MLLDSTVTLLPSNPTYIRHDVDSIIGGAMIGLGRPHHSAIDFSQRLFSPLLVFMVVLVCCVFVVVCDGFWRGFMVVVVVLVFCGGSWRSSWWVFI
jgi:hypothetical protein